MNEGVLRVLRFYPQIYLACHGQHRTPQVELGISEREARVLGHLDRSTPTSPAWLARHIGVGASTLSAAIARLHQRALISITRRADDKRRVDLRLTATGLRAIAATSVLDAGTVSQVLDRLTPDEQRRAVDGLDLLARASREHLAARGHPLRDRPKHKKQPKKRRIA